MKRPGRKAVAAKKSPEAELPPVDPRFRPIVEAFADRRDVSRRRMFSSSSVLSVKGKIFCMMVKGRFVAKLPRQRVAHLVESDLGRYFDPGHGRLMKEWVSVHDDGPPWIDLARDAYSFVKTGKA